MSERSMFDAAAHEVKMLMMHTRATFYATQPINVESGGLSIALSCGGV